MIIHEIKHSSHSALRQSTLTDAVCTNIIELRYLGATMASLDDQLNKLKDQLAKEKESQEAAEARAEAKAETRADEQRKQHEALLKILSQLQSSSGHEKAKNQDTPVQEAPVAGDDGEMSPSNDGGSVVPAEAETEWDQLGGRGQARDFAPIVEVSSHTHSGRGVNMKITPLVLKDR